MEKAIKAQKGTEELVSASEIRHEFHGKIPQGVNFICPICRQPLFPAAMSARSKQAPHFRHERNNESAHECELYVSNYGYYTTYQRTPMPMFIRRSRTGNGMFIVEGGFRRLDQRDLYALEQEGAMIKIAQKTYRVTAQRFSAGLTKLPFEEVSLNCESAIQLVGTSLSLNSTWGYPENARYAMVFTRDVDTEQGKRLKIGDTIPFETNLFLLAPEKEHTRIRSAFENSRRVGTTGKRASMFNLAVFEVRLTKNEVRWKHSKRYLEECGFRVDDFGDTPKLIWPPSLTSDGDLLPLFENARCIFTADMRSTVDNCLYLHTNDNASEQVKIIQLRKSESGESGFAILENTAKLSFVTTRNWIFSSAVLLHSSDLVINEWLHKIDLEPRISLDSGCWILELARPDEVIRYKRNEGIQVLKAAESDASFLFEKGSFDLLQIRRKLGASPGHLIIFEKTFDSQLLSGKDSAKAPKRKYVLTPGMANDAIFAMTRKNGDPRRQDGTDKQRALCKKRGNRYEPF